MPATKNFRINDEQELYVIPFEVDGEEGFSCYGFDNALNELDRVTQEQVARGSLTQGEQEAFMRLMREQRGSRLVFETLLEQREETRRIATEQGERCLFNLTPQLAGLERRTVEVRDTPTAKPRRFIVGRSTGWAPCHLEIELDHDEEESPGHDPAARQYHSVEVVG